MKKRKFFVFLGLCLLVLCACGGQVLEVPTEAVEETLYEKMRSATATYIVIVPTEEVKDSLDLQWKVEVWPSFDEIMDDLPFQATSILLVCGNEKDGYKEFVATELSDAKDFCNSANFYRLIYYYDPGVLESQA